MRRLMAYLWQREFAWRLSRAANTHITVADLRRVIARLPKAKMPGQDAAKRFNLELAQGLHAAVVYLEGDMAMPSQQALAVAREAFLATGNWLVRWAIRAWLRLEKDPFDGVNARGPSSLAKAMWGQGMAVEDRRTEGAISLCVTSCPFQDYFWNAGRTDLTPILCAWDTAWQQEVNTSDAPLHVDIRSTLATGGLQCEFTFQRTVRDASHDRRRTAMRPHTDNGRQSQDLGQTPDISHGQRAEAFRKPQPEIYLSGHRD